MDSEELAEEFKLDITVLSNDRYREVVFKPSPDQHEKQERSVLMWSRAHVLANNVYLYQSLRGDYRVVKRVALQKRNEIRSELSAIGLIKKSTEAQNQENFVEFEGWFLSHDHIYFMMEYCQHGDISCCFQDPLSEPEAHSICRQLLEALKLLHDLGIVHRDIKPQNVLIAQKYPIQVKLADFGISKIMDNTELRTQIGTYGYMAPEIFPGLLECTGESSRYTYSSAVDIWSLGCLLYSVLTGHSPFPGSPYLSLGDYANGRSGFPENPLLERGVSLAGRSFIFKLMCPLPERRPKATVSLLDDWVIPLKAAELPKRPGPIKAPELRLKEEQTMSLPVTTYGVRQTKARSPEKQDNHSLSSPGAFQALPQTGKAISRADEVSHSLQLWGLFERADTPEDGNKRVLIHLESGANPDFIHNGFSLLLLSLSKPTSWLDTLLEYGANPQIQDKDGRSLIHSIVEIASSVPKHTQIQEARNAIVKLRNLTAHGASLDVYDSKGLTPIIYASTLENTEIVKVLVSEGANINAKCPLGLTALIYASTLRNLEMARCLVEQGANINARCHLGRTSLIYACTPANITMRAISPKRENAEGNKLTRFLVEKGVDINIRCASGCTALHYVSEAKRHDLAMLFVEHGADVNSQDQNGRTPLHYAAKVPANDLLVKLLVQSGVKINQKTNDSLTALEIASKLDDHNGTVVRYLVKVGAECVMEDTIVKRRVLRAQRWLKVTGQL